MISTILDNLFAASIEFVECFIFVGPFLVMTRFYAKKQGIRIQKTHLLGELLFAYLILFMLEFTGISSLARILYIGIEIHPETFNFIPFRTIKIDALNYITNIILFMPFGFLCPALWENQRSVKQVALAGFLFSLTIEVSQIFNLRITDVDDLLMNTLGAVFGYFIFKIIQKISFIKYNIATVGHNELPFILKHELWFLLYIVFSCAFFVLPYLP